MNDVLIIGVKSTLATERCGCNPKCVMHFRHVLFTDIVSIYPEIVPTSMLKDPINDKL